MMPNLAAHAHPVPVLQSAHTPAANPAAAAAPPRPAPAAAAPTAAALAPPAVPTVPAARVTPPKVPAAPRLPNAVLERALSNSSGNASARQANSSGVVEVTLLHFNDWHVRVESSKGRWCGLCTPYDVKKGEAALRAYPGAQPEAVKAAFKA